MPRCLMDQLPVCAAPHCTGYVEKGACVASQSQSHSLRRVFDWSAGHLRALPSKSGVQIPEIHLYLAVRSAVHVRRLRPLVCPLLSTYMRMRGVSMTEWGYCAAKPLCMPSHTDAKRQFRATLPYHLKKSAVVAAKHTVHWLLLHMDCLLPAAWLALQQWLECQPRNRR